MKNKAMFLISALLIAVILSLSAVSAADDAIAADIDDIDDSIEVSSVDLSADTEDISYTDVSFNTSKDKNTLSSNIVEEGDGSWYVDSKVETTGDGSQSSPYKTIKEAFDASGGNGTIYLASGVYNTTNDRSFSLALDSGNNLSIIGAGSDETLIDLLSLSNNFINVRNGNNFYLSNVKLIRSGTTAISGANITIEDSVFANSYYYGGAPILSLGGGDNTIRNCVFVNNSAGSWYGSGVAILNGNANVLFDNCLFKNNTNTNGGSVFYTTSSNIKLTLNNCNVTECPVAFYASYFGNVVFNNSYFYNNDVTRLNNRYCAVFYSTDPGNLTIDYCKFENNTGVDSASIISAYSSNRPLNLTVTNSEFIDNKMGKNSYGYYTVFNNIYMGSWGGNLYLKNNTGSFGNLSFVSISSANINSEINLIVLDNTTYDINAIEINVIGTLTDDMGNPINMSGFDLYFNDTLVGSQLTFDSGVNNYTFKEALSGSYLVKYVYNSTANFTNFNQKTSVMNISPLENIDVYVATDGSDETGDGTEANPYATVEKALDVASTALNANVYIKAGTYKYYRYRAIDTANGILNIIGYDGDVTIDMNNETAFCNVSNRSNVFISNVDFVNGYSQYLVDNYGIINSFGNLILSECKFSDNNGYYYIISGQSTIDSCTFENNKFQQQNSARILFNPAYVNNVTFYNITAIGFSANSLNQKYDLTIENCKFYDNARILISNGNVTIRSSEFANLSNQRALETQGVVVLSIDDCTFKDSDQSVIYLYDYASTTIANISNSKFINITHENPVYVGNGQEIYLENNEVSDLAAPYVYIRSGYVASPITILVLNNETIEQESYGATLKAKVLDDSENAISLNSFVFDFNDEQINGKLVYDEMVAKSMGIYDGTYLVSASSTNLLNPILKTGVLIITPLMNKELYVSTGGSDETGDGTEVNPYATLKKAMDEAVAFNNTIHVAEGVYAIDTALEIDTNTAIVNIVGSGENTVFDMNNEINFINTISANSIIELKDLTLANAKSPANAKGGFITNLGNLTVNNVNFINSTANNGAAIRSSGNLSVTDSYFENTVASSNGGAIWSNGGNNYVLNSIFNKTSASNYGGALYSRNYLYIKDNTFIDTSASAAKNIYVQSKVEGGVVLTVMDNSTWTISTSSVTFNATLTDENNDPIYASNIPVSFYLDGIKVASSSINGEKVTANANLKMNGEHIASASLGTAEDITVKTATVSFVNDAVAHDVYVSANGDDETGNGTQENPYAHISKALTVVESLNGVIHIMTNLTNVPVNSIDGFYNLTIMGENNEIFIKNSTSGFVMLNSGSLNLLNLRFTEANYPTYFIFTRAGSSLSLENCSYENVYYPKDGYYPVFIDSSSDFLSLKNCKVINNVFNLSDLSSGVIRSKSNTTFEDCVFANNSYTNRNGALGGNFLLFSNNQKVFLKNCIFDNNTARLLNFQSTSVVDNCSFTENNGTLITASYPINITNNNFTSNDLVSSLIGVSGNAEITNNIVKENTASAFVFASGSAIVNIHDNTLNLGDMPYVNLTGNTKITGSTFTLTVNDNDTYEIEGLNLAFNASLVDADGNIIYGPLVYFTLNGSDIISANLVPIAIANTKFGGEGEFIASARTDAMYDSSEWTIKTSVFNIKQIAEKIIYVDILGSDETGDGSEENPYASLERAVQDAGGLNNIIYIQPGEYDNMTLGSQYVLIDDQTLSIIGLSNEVDKVIIKNLDNTFADIAYEYGKYSNDQFTLANIEFVDSSLSTDLIRTNYVNAVLVENVVFDNITVSNLIRGDSTNLVLINSTINAISSSCVLNTENITVLDSVISNAYGYRIFTIGARHAADLTIYNSALINNSYIGALIYEQWTSTKTLENNWWGYNTTEDDLMAFTNVEITNWIVAEVTPSSDSINIGDNVQFDILLKLNDGSELTDVLPTRIVTAIAENTEFDEDEVEIIDNQATITGTVTGTGDITITIDEQDFVFPVNGYVAYLTVDNLAVNVGDPINVCVLLQDEFGPLAGELVTIWVNEVEYNDTTNDDGMAIFEIDGLEKGNYIVTASFAGDELYDGTSAVGLIMVSDAILSIDIPAVDYGSPITIYATVEDSEGNPLSGLVIATLDGVDCNIYVDAGEGSITIPNELFAGEYLVTAKLLGENNAMDTALLVVNPIEAELIVSIDNITYNNPVEVELSSEYALDGIVILTIDGVDYAIEIEDGEAIALLPILLDSKDYEVTAKFIGENFDVEDATTSFTVEAIETALTLELENSTITYGDFAIVKVSLVDELGNPMDGIVTLTVGDQTGSLAVVNGEGTVSVPYLAAGNYTVTAKFEGSANFIYDEDSASLEVTADDNVQFDMDVIGNSLVISLVDGNDNPMDATVTVTIDGESQDVTVENGIGFVYDLEAGDHTVSLDYDGDADHASASMEDEVTILPDPVVPVSANATIELAVVGDYVEVTLKDLDGNPIAGADLEADLNNFLLSTVTTDDDGKALVDLYGEPNFNFTVTVVYTDDLGSSVSASLNNIYVENETTVIIYENVTVPVTANGSMSVEASEDAITATLTDSDGKPLANATVTAVIDGVETNFTTDESGKLTVPIDENSTVELSYTDDNGASVTYTTKVVTNEVPVPVPVPVPVTVNGTIALATEDGKSIVATLTDSDGKAIADAELTISVNGQESTVKTDANGKATVDVEGNTTVVATYKDANNLTATGYMNLVVIVNETIINETIIVIPNRTETVIDYQNMTTTVVASADGRIGEYFTVVLRDDKGNALADKPIKIGFNGRVYDRVTDENGSAKLQINLGYKGTYTFAIGFLGDDNYTGAFEVAKITVNLQTPKLSTSSKTYKASAKTKALTATLKTVNGNGISNKKISFTVNGKTYSGTTNDKGVATVKVSLSTKGTYSFTAKFAGDDQFAKVTANGKLTIK
ncbi:adhesin-like protein [Methanobrevibacter ruminantium M1]|uniref:Adhesin-like protein n=1 Tax=Methanobrevibacter ruminantium (strain ATCC 35063 / DSM 1093 / JCM 13430 / OCM 146 / M1) TaxID=634498 RepID=D3E2R9_METRM|nr:Ig-like domain repeat protein [Methanobrevibacter ruminantium]ADC46830.1 adhesin-like protein [Methanobrevibacter ruminantium M1]